jgi:hypothetical protein
MLEILSMLGSATGGGLLGIAGNFLKSRTEIKLKKINHEHEVTSRIHDIEEMKLEATLRKEQILLENAGQLALANVEAQRSQDVAASELMADSFTMDKASYGGGFVDTIRGLIRPLITVYLLVAFSYLCYKVTTMVMVLDAISNDELVELYTELIHSVIFLTTTATCWWFGSRATNK